MSMKYSVPSGAKAMPNGLYWSGFLPSSAMVVPGTGPRPGSGWPVSVTHWMPGFPM